MSDIRRRAPADPSGSSLVSEEPTLNEKDKDVGLKHGVFMQILRSLLLATWFNGCCVCIFMTQLIGAPLYFVNKNYYYAYMAMTKQCFGILIVTITQWGAPTVVRVSGDESVKGQIQLGANGLLKTNFPDRLVFVANHQVYTDWLYLWWVSYTSRMHGHIYIILKESLKRIPVIGQGMMFYGFIFMAQGTNLSINTKNISNKYGEKQLRGTVDWVYDCTVGYEGPPKGIYPDRYFTLRSTYGQGRPPKSVNMYWRRWALEEIPLDDPKDFEQWLLERWREKDALLDQFFETGRFPTSLDSSIETQNIPAKQKDEASRGYAETEIQLARWIEVVEIFAVLLLVGFLCRTF
uniref:Putative acyltransferase n=1 Tax=Talaromyces marneffei PM1 TaxID=1077442 RepID=A0A093UUS9_TALMA